ncbi:MAG: hypothetical protein ACOY4F_06280 [Thermodesulfobacteriota bacterium]
MSVAWEKHDDTTYFVNLAKAVLVAVVYDRMGGPGWKVQVGKRSLKDKFASVDDAKKVAVAFADRVLTQCREDLDSLKAADAPPENG